MGATRLRNLDAGVEIDRQLVQQKIGMRIFPGIIDPGRRIAAAEPRLGR